MFHRVDDWTTLPSPRFFRMAERLHLRDGAVRAARALTGREEVNTGPAPAPVAAAPQQPDLDISTVAAMSQQPGFPSIAYTSDGG